MHLLATGRHVDRPNQKDLLEGRVVVVMANRGIRGEEKKLAAIYKSILLEESAVKANSRGRVGKG